MNVYLTKHALRRMGEMDVGRQEVIDCINDPEVSWIAVGGRNARDDGKETTTAKRGRIAVGYLIEDDEVVVLTVLHNTSDRYERQGV